MALEFLTYEIWGNTLKSYIQFLLLIVIGFIVTKLLVFISKSIILKVVKRTKTKMDDIIIGVLSKPRPIQIIIVTIFTNIGINYLTISESLSAFLKHAFFAVYVLGATWFTINFIIGIITEYLERYAKDSASKYDDQSIPLLKTLTKIVLIIIAVSIVLTDWGYNVTAILAGLGIGGLAVAFAAKDVIENFLCGVIIFTEKPFKMGDYITISDNKITGTVESIGIRSTKIRTIDDVLITIPNNKITTTHIDNISLRRKIRCELTLGLVYDTSIEKINKAKKIIKNILKQKNEIDPAYRITFDDFGEFALKLKLIYYVNSPDWNKYIEIKDYVNAEIKKQFEKAKIEFAFPTQTIELKK